MPVEKIVFWVFSGVLILTSLMVVSSRNPVRSVLFLVAAFVASSVLWILLEAEFLGLILIFVYVGAVMTLFMFVVMMLNIDLEVLKVNFVRYLPLGIILVALMVGLMVYVLSPEHFSSLTVAHRGADYSNIKELGSVVYTDYVFPLELAAVILVIAIIASITLTHRVKSNNKRQDIHEQLQAKKSERLRVVKMPAEKKQ